MLMKRIMRMWGINFLISYPIFVFVFKQGLIESFILSFGLSTAIIGLIVVYAILTNLTDWMSGRKLRRKDERK